MKTSRFAAVSLIALPLVALPFVGANDQVGGRFVFDQVRRGAIATSIEATGTVEAVETVEVGTEVSGLIAKVFVDFNDAVAAGQPIAELDRAGFQARVAEARAALKVSKAVADVQQSALHRAEIAKGSRVSVTKLARNAGRLEGLSVALADGHVVKVTMAQVHTFFRVVSE